MLFKTNYTQVISDRKISAPLKKLENPLFIENLRIKKDFKKNVFFKPCKPFDFTESYRINNTEAFVSAALSKKKNLILKDGYKFESENEQDIKYIKKRLNENEYLYRTKCIENYFREIKNETKNVNGIIFIEHFLLI